MIAGCWLDAFWQCCSRTYTANSSWSFELESSDLALSTINCSLLFLGVGMSLVFCFCSFSARLLFCRWGTAPTRFDCACPRSLTSLEFPCLLLLLFDEGMLFALGDEDKCIFRLGGSREWSISFWFYSLYSLNVILWFLMTGTISANSMPAGDLDSDFLWASRLSASCLSASCRNLASLLLIL